MSYHAYMIKSESTERYYYGHTSDLDERLISHNSKKKWAHSVYVAGRRAASGLSNHQPIS